MKNRIICVQDKTLSYYEVITEMIGQQKNDIHVDRSVSCYPNFSGFEMKVVLMPRQPICIMWTGKVFRPVVLWATKSLSVFWASIKYYAGQKKIHC